MKWLMDLGLLLGLKPNQNPKSSPSFFQTAATFFSQTAAAKSFLSSHKAAPLSLHFLLPSSATAKKSPEHSRRVALPEYSPRLADSLLASSKPPSVLALPRCVRAMPRLQQGAVDRLPQFSALSSEVHYLTVF
ncbi:hypothetical protein AKJ16_DCAP06471 [Drosera capensis]